MSGNRMTFVYDHRLGNAIALAVLLIFLGGMAFLAASDGAWDFVAAFVVVSLIFSFIFGLLIVARSDVVVSEEGIERILWGWTWRTMSWTNVSRIKQFRAPRGNGQFVWAMNIFPKVKPAHRFTPSGKVFFSMDVRNSHDLTLRLNEYIAKHGIQLEVCATQFGRPEQATELLS